MELVKGQPLTDHCRPNDLLSPEQIIEIGYKCCKALEFANGLGVVHRDIKPANILMEATTTSRWPTSARRSSRAAT